MIPLLRPACLVLALALSSGGQLVHEAGTLRGFLAGDAPGCAYDNWISHVSENVARAGYNAYAPVRLDPQLNGFGGFQLVAAGATGDSLLAFFRGLGGLLLTGDVAAATQLLADAPGSGYELAVLSDSSLARDFLVLREPLDSSWTDPGLSPGLQDDVVGGFARGWGVYIFNPAAARPDLALQVPHPCDDFSAPFIGLEAYLALDAGLLMINGAGREVAYTGEASAYTNSLSLSDPSRNCRLPFAALHQAFLAHVRGQGRTELVVQLHSYDDLAHRTLTSCVVTAGPANRIHYPVLFDTGGGAKGLLGNLRQPIFPADSLGWPHVEWRLQDFISSNSSYPVHVSGGLADSLILVPTAGSLPGYGANCQILASYGAGYPECDQLERFLHIELDELPTPAHVQGTPAFYGCGADTLVADWRNFAGAWAFHRPLFDALGTAVDSLALFTDADPPTAPGGLTASQLGSASARLAWSPTRSVHFNTYEVLVDTAQVIGPSPRVVSRANSAGLCWPGLRGVDLAGLTPGLSYSFALRARDAQDRVSELSNTVRLHITDILPPVVEVDERRLAWAGTPVSIRATVTDHSPLASVLLRWSLAGGMWQDTPMADVGGGIHEALIGPFAVEDTLRYLVEATDLPSSRSTACSDTTRLIVREMQSGQDFDTADMAWHEPFGGGVDQWRREACQALGGQAWRFGAAGCANYLANGAAWLTLDSLIVPDGLREPVAAIWSRIDAETVGQYPDSCYDGGLVQWRLDGGQWEPAALEPPATHGLRSTSTVPLDWPQCMLSGRSGWRQLLMPLPDGCRLVELRFGFVSDGAVHKGGWALDELGLGGVAPESLTTPDISLQLMGNQLRLSWWPVAGALRYRVEMAEDAWSGTWIAALTTAETWAMLSMEDADHRRCFRVIAEGAWR